MHIAELAAQRQLDHIYRCDSMPLNRWYLFGVIEGDVYLRNDGSIDNFDFRIENDKYRVDETWVDYGPVSRSKSGSLIISDLPKLTM